MTSSAIRIILVDDAVDFRALLRRLLELEPDLDVVAEADDGASGLAAIVQHRPHVVVTDLQMPVMDGLELTRQLHASGYGQPVVMVTGSPLPDLDRLAAEAGVTRLFDKAAALTQLAPALRDVAGSSAAGVSL